MNVKKVSKYSLLIGLILIVILFIIFLNKKEPIKIGLMVTLTGTYPDLGREIRDGAILAVELINQGGGVNGKPLELIIRDNQSSYEIAKKNYEEFFKENVVAVVGPATSTTAKNLLSLINDRKLTLIAPTPTSSELAGLDDYLIRLRPTNIEDSKVIAEYILENLKAKRISVVYDVFNSAYTIDFIEKLSSFLDDNTIIFTYPFSNRDTNFRSFSKRLLTNSPEVLIVILDVYDTSLLIQNLRVMKSKIPVIITIWAKSPKLIEFCGKWSEGIIAADNIEFPLKGDKGEMVREKFIKKYGRDMNFASVNGFDSVMVLKKALEKGANRENMKETILKIRKFEGIQGEIIFDEFGDRQTKSFILKVENGKFKKLER